MLHSLFFILYYRKLPWQWRPLKWNSFSLDGRLKLHDKRRSFRLYDEKAEDDEGKEKVEDVDEEKKGACPQSSRRSCLACMRLILNGEKSKYIITPRRDRIWRYMRSYLPMKRDDKWNGMPSKKMELDGTSKYSISNPSHFSSQLSTIKEWKSSISSSSSGRINALKESATIRYSTEQN